MVGLKFWNDLGDTLMIELGDSHDAILDRAATPKGGFALDISDTYNLYQMCSRKNTSRIELFIISERTSANIIK